MKAILLIELVCVFIGVAAVSPWYRDRGYGPMSSYRSRQSPWYRSSRRDRYVEGHCSHWNNFFELELYPDVYGGLTEHGFLCRKSLGSVRILTWCDFEEVYQGKAEILRMYPTLVNSRPSTISTCQIHDIILRGQELNGGEVCFFTLKRGILQCVAEEELQPQYQILTVYPVLKSYQDFDLVGYIICSRSMGTYCPGPAKIVTMTVDFKEKFRNFDCPKTESTGFWGCQYGMN